MDKQELLWREYQMSVDLYKFYIDVVVKIILAYFAVTSGVLSFYFTRTDLKIARWALVFPILVSFALVVLFVWGAELWKRVKVDANRIAGQLDMGSGFELSILGKILHGSALMLALCGIAMAILVVAYQPASPPPLPPH